MEPEPSPHGSGQHHFINDAVTRFQRPTAVRHGVTRSIGFIVLRADARVTEEQTQRRHSQRLETAGNRRSSIGCATTRNLRRPVSTCCFWPRRLNNLGFVSRGYSFHDSIETADLSGPENGSARRSGSMSYYTESSRNHTTTDKSTINQQAPAECPACDCTRITVETGMWHCEFCGASGRCRGDGR